MSRSEQVQALVLLGELHLRRARLKKAETVFAEALKLASGDARAQRGLAQTLFESGRFSEALARFEASVKVDPNHLCAGRRFRRNRHIRCRAFSAFGVGSCVPSPVGKGTYRLLGCQCRGRVGPEKLPGQHGAYFYRRLRPHTLADDKSGNAAVRLSQVQPKYAKPGLPGKY